MILIKLFLFISSKDLASHKLSSDIRQIEIMQSKKIRLIKPMKLGKVS